MRGVIRCISQCIANCSTVASGPSSWRAAINLRSSFISRMHFRQMPEMGSAFRMPWQCAHCTPAGGPEGGAATASADGSPS